MAGGGVMTQAVTGSRGRSFRGGGEVTLYCRHCGFSQIWTVGGHPCGRCGGMIFSTDHPGESATGTAIADGTILTFEGQMSRDDRDFLRALNISSA